MRWGVAHEGGMIPQRGAPLQQHVSCAPMKPAALVASIAGLLAGTGAQAQSAFEFSGSVRGRYEALSGQSRPGFKADDQLVSFRTILSAGYDSGVVRFGAELYDSRAYIGDSGSAISTNEVNALEPVQLYVGLDFEEVFGAGSSLGVQAGRQMMNIGSRRLVSNDDYRNTGTSHDGLRIDGRFAGGWDATVWYVQPVQRLPDDLDAVLDNHVRLDRSSRNVVLWGGIVTSPRRVAGAVDLAFVKFRERDASDRPTRERNLDTWALRWYRDAAPGHWDFEFEVMHQSGRARTGTAATASLRDVDAGFVHARIGYQWTLPWKPRLAVEFDRAGGRFDTLYGGRRFDFAPSGLYNQVGRANISSPGLRLELAPGTRADFMGTWRLLGLASATDAFSTTGVRDPSGLAGRSAGQQLDTRVRYWLVPQRLRLEVDGIFLIKGRFLEQAPNARPGDTRYYSLNLSWAF
jgi:hypothetical protein